MRRRNGRATSIWPSSCLWDAGQEGLTATIQAGDIQMSPDMAAIVEQNAAEAGITLSVGVTANSDFYGEYWCAGASYGTQPTPAARAAHVARRLRSASSTTGIARHRMCTSVVLWKPPVTGTHRNYARPDFDALFAQYQAAVEFSTARRRSGSDPDASSTRMRLPSTVLV